MTAVGVARGVGVVLEQVDIPGDALLAEPPAGVDQEPLQDSLPGLVVGDQVDHVVALGCRVLGMAAHVQVQAGAVAEEHVAAAAPRYNAAEEVARHLIRRQPPLSPEGARNAVLVLEPEYSPVHVPRLRSLGAIGHYAPPKPGHRRRTA